MSNSFSIYPGRMEVSISISFHSIWNCLKKVTKKSAQLINSRAMLLLLLPGSVDNLTASCHPGQASCKTKAAHRHTRPLTNMDIQMALHSQLNPMAFPLALLGLAESLFCTNLLSMHGFISLLSAGSEPADHIPARAHEAFQKREHRKAKWRDAQRLCESQAVLGMDGRQILLHPKQLRSVLLSCLCIILPIQAFPYPQDTGPSLLPPITPRDKRRLLEASPQAGTLPERRSRLLGLFCGVKLIFFFSLFFQGLLVLPILFHKENLRLTLAWSSKLLSSPLKAQNHPSLWMQENNINEQQQQKKKTQTKTTHNNPTKRTIEIKLTHISSWFSLLCFPLSR